MAETIPNGRYHNCKVRVIGKDKLLVTLSNDLTLIVYPTPALLNDIDEFCKQDVSIYIVNEDAWPMILVGNGLMGPCSKYTIVFTRADVVAELI